MAVQDDIKKMEDAIANLKAGGEELFADEIKNLEAKLTAAKQEAEKEAVATAQEVKTDVEKVGGEIKQGEEDFVKKYGSTITNGLKIVLLAAIAGRLFGII